MILAMCDVLLNSGNMDAMFGLNPYQPMQRFVLEMMWDPQVYNNSMRMIL